MLDAVGIFKHCTLAMPKRERERERERARA